MRPEGLRLVVTASCPHCKAPQAVNRLDATAFCGACGRERAITPATWSRLLREAIVAAPGLRPGVTRSAHVDGLTLQYRRVELACFGCGGAIAVGDDHCGPCGRPVRARAIAEAPFGAEVPELSHVFGEPLARGFDEQASALPCEGCGAALPLEGNTQTITCAFCARVHHVPARFLYRGHRDLPEPFGVLFARPLEPAGDAGLGDIFDWENPATEVPEVLPLGGGRVLIAGARRGFELGRDDLPEPVERTFLLALEPTADHRPAVAWTRDDLALARPTERHPYVLSPGAARLLVRTRAGIVHLDARTGDTLAVTPSDGPDQDVFRRASIELARAPREEGDARRAARGEERLAIADADHLLAIHVDDEPPRLRVALVDHAGAEVARGSHRLPGAAEIEREDVRASLAGDHVVLAAGGDRVAIARRAATLRFELVGLPRTKGRARAVGFGEAIAVVGDRGAFRVYDLTGALVFDAAALPRTKKRSIEQLAREGAELRVAKVLEESRREAEVEERFQRATEDRERRANLRLLRNALLGALALVALVAVLFAFVR